MEFKVSGTRSRPAGLPLFVLSKNSLNPKVELHFREPGERERLEVRLAEAGVNVR